MLKYLFDLLKEFLEALVTYFWKFFTEFYEKAFTEFILLIESSIEKTGNHTDLSWTLDIYESINFFFPLNESLALLTVYLTIWWVVFYTKLALKLFPGVY